MAAALVVLVGACGSSSSKAKSGSNGGSNSTAGSTSPGGGSSGGGNSLSDLAAKGKTANIKITYKVTGEGDNSSFTLIQRGNDSVEKFGNSALYNVAGKTTTCSGTGSDITCTSIGSLGGAANPLGAMFTAYTGLLTNSAYRSYLGNANVSDQTIAGRSAKCVSVSGGIAASVGVTGTVCVDSQTGVLLKAAGSAAGHSGSLEATSVGSPSDSDFQLPKGATVQTIPGNITVPNITMPTNTP